MRDNWGAITGYGCVSALGHTALSFREALFSGTTGIGPLTLPVTDPRLKINLAAQVKNWDPSDFFPKEKRAFLDPFSQYALVAAREAVALSRIDPGQLKGHRTAVVLGTGAGGIATQDEACRLFYQENSRRGDPLTVPKLMANAAVSHISMEFGITGPAFSVASACASSNHAMAVALFLLRSGAVDRVLTGGAEAPISLASMRSWEFMRVLSPKGCAPFSLGRMGMVLGEGAGVFLLERPALAQERRADVHGRLCGAGLSSDACDLLRPDPQGAGQAVRGALEDAGLSPEQISYINAHGTGTVTNDQVETAVVKNVFGAHAYRLAISSTKALHGHALGAAGALEAVATLLALRDGRLPPTVNWTGGDPDCDLDYVPNTARSADVTFALSNSFAFGGLNAVLCFGKGD